MIAPKNSHMTLDDAVGRVLAENVAATLTQPPFDASAMDGFAVRFEDVATLPATLALIGESAAGARFEGSVAPGQAVRIFTGAPVPDGFASSGISRFRCLRL